MSKLHIVGGGLAGMTVAWQVTREERHPFSEVIIYERDGRLGGKAGSESLDSQSPPWSDHGYHLFPRWYHNVIEVMGQIGIDYHDSVVEGERFDSAVRQNDISSDAPPSAVQSAKRVLARTKWLEYQSNDEVGGHKPYYVKRKSGKKSMWALYVTALDLIATRDPVLQKLSVEAFIRRRYPCLAPWALPAYENLLLQALSARNDKSSALALAKMFRRWTQPFKRLWSPSWSSLKGGLQGRFIKPYQDALEHAGVEVRTEWKLTSVQFDGDMARSLTFEGRPPVALSDSDRLVLAVTPDVLAEVSGGADSHDQLHRAAQQLAVLTAQFSAVDIYFKNPQKTPHLHFGFDVEGVATTGYNITPVWDKEELVRPEAPTVVQLVIPEANVTTESELQDKVKNELGQLLNFDAEDHWEYHVNRDSPLCLANTAIYQARADLPKLGNVYISGDFMPSSMEVPSMEAAVGNGRNVGAALLGVPEHEWPDQDVEVHWFLRGVAYAVRPIVMVLQLPLCIVHIANRIGSWFKDRVPDPAE